MIQIIQLQGLLTSGHRADTIGSQLTGGAGEDHTLHAIWSQIADSPLCRAQMVEGLQECRYVETENTRHEHSDGDHYACYIDGKARMAEERVKHYTDRLTAGNDAEDVEGHDEI